MPDPIGNVDSRTPPPDLGMICQTCIHIWYTSQMGKKLELEMHQLRGPKYWMRRRYCPRLCQTMRHGLRGACLDVERACLDACCFVSVFDSFRLHLAFRRLFIRVHSISIGNCVLRPWRRRVVNKPATYLTLSSHVRLSPSLSGCA